MPSLSYGKCGTALQRPQPSPWMQEIAVSSFKPPPPFHKLRGTLQPLCQVFKIRSCPKRGKAPHSLLSKQLPHPLTPASRHSLCCPRRPKEIRLLNVGLQADQVAGTSSWRICQKRPHLFLESWKNKSSPGFQSDVMLSACVYAGWGWKWGPCVSQTGVPQHSPHQQVGR